MQYSKKAQIEMIEMIMIMVVVVILLLVAVFFYFKFYAVSISKSGEQLTQQEAEVLLTSITSMPELQCSLESENKFCIDLYKVSAFRSLVNDPNDRSGMQYYSNIFKNKGIVIKSIYPNSNNGECPSQLVEYPVSCNTWIIYTPGKAQSYTKKPLISTIVSLYHPITKQYGVGKIIIEAYS
ncbi:hypothetical protein HYX19_04695 [Candidatus Woesearchaeota archaeon]|nr:hypothetical protein [Candidatus Woesearchaeota archaeon]